MTKTQPSRRITANGSAHQGGETAPGRLSLIFSSAVAMALVTGFFQMVQAYSG